MRLRRLRTEETSQDGGEKDRRRRTKTLGTESSVVVIGIRRLLLTRLRPEGG